MVQPVFRNPSKIQVLPFRDWLRANKPAGQQGYIVEDLDLVLRVYGTNFHTDATGKFIFIELKFRNAWIGTSKIKTFGLLDSLCRAADPDHLRYLGYYIVQYDNEDWDIANFRINKVNITREEFIDKFLNLDNNFLTSLPMAF